MSLRCPACGNADYVTGQDGDLVTGRCMKLECAVQNGTHYECDTTWLRESHAKLLQACKATLAWFDGEESTAPDKPSFQQLVGMCREAENLCRAAIAFAEPQEPTR
jgi:hypothetical protein